MNNIQNNIDNTISYRKIMEENDFFIATPVGTSMLPMIRERIDTVKLVKVARNLQKGDVILYERPNNTYVLHRIVGIKNKNGEKKYILCGDNQVLLEKYVDEKQIIAVVEGYFRGESYISCDDKSYKRYVKRRIRSRKWRKVRYVLAKIYRKIFKRNQA